MDHSRASEGGLGRVPVNGHPYPMFGRCSGCAESIDRLAVLLIGESKVEFLCQETGMNLRLGNRVVSIIPVRNKKSDFGFEYRYLQRPSRV